MALLCSITKILASEITIFLRLPLIQHKRLDSLKMSVTMAAAVEVLARMPRTKPGVHYHLQCTDFRIS